MSEYIVHSAAMDKVAVPLDEELLAYADDLLPLSCSTDMLAGDLYPAELSMPLAPILEQAAPTWLPPPAASVDPLLNQPFTLVPWGAHTIAIPTSQITPQLLQSLQAPPSLSGISSAAPVREQAPEPLPVQPVKPTPDDVATTKSSRLQELGMELNLLLNDNQRAELNRLHRMACSASLGEATVAKEAFWKLWYAVAPTDKVDELRALMNASPVTSGSNGAETAVKPVGSAVTQKASADAAKPVYSGELQPPSPESQVLTPPGPPPVPVAAAMHGVAKMPMSRQDSTHSSSSERKRVNAMMAAELHDTAGNNGAGKRKASASTAGAPAKQLKLSDIVSELQACDAAHQLELAKLKAQLQALEHAHVQEAARRACTERDNQRLQEQLRRYQQKFGVLAA